MPVTWRSECARQDFGTNAGAFTGGPPKVVLHSTEGGSWPDYRGGSVAPHETWKWTGKGFEKRQHVSHALAAMALIHPAGVQTNRDSVHQIELIGTCDRVTERKYGLNYLPAMGDDFYAALGAELVKLCNDLNVPLVVTNTWDTYPASAGFGAAQRFSLSQWDNFTGLCGHQHVYGNDHGDPGSLQVAHSLELAGGGHVVVPPPPPIKPPAVHAPGFPLAPGNYFGPKSGPNQSHSGYYSADDRNQLRIWQQQMRVRGWTIAVDGLYADQTAKVTRQFQAEKHLGVDGKIGPATWTAAWTAPTT